MKPRVLRCYAGFRPLITASKMGTPFLIACDSPHGHPRKGKPTTGMPLDLQGSKDTRSPRASAGCHLVLSRGGSYRVSGISLHPQNKDSNDRLRGNYHTLHRPSLTHRPDF